MSPEELAMSLVNQHRAALRGALNPAHSDPFDAGMFYAVENVVMLAMGLTRNRAKDLIRYLVERD